MSLDVCSSGHDEIVHNNPKKCPLCWAFEEIDDFSEKNADLTNRNSDLEDTVEELKQKLNVTEKQNFDLILENANLDAKILELQKEIQNFLDYEEVNKDNV